ncbi:MAG: cysteine desulfurase-like protein [Planctomycetaceae bacterium]|nr:cysteine desulfurase-like protein [Planctomycetaceae bacterium]
MKEPIQPALQSLRVRTVNGLNIEAIRQQFPAFDRHEGDHPVAYFDGPAGSQVPQSVIDAVGHYMAHTNSNCGAPISTSQESDTTLQHAREALADFVGGSDPDEIVFGPNMTTLTLALSRTLGQTWGPGDEVVVTQLDHDANVTPWVLAAQRAGATVHHVPIDLTNCTLDQSAYARLLSPRTKFVAIGYASNAVGTVNPVKQMISAAREMGALTFVDAVHLAPHRLIDVAELQCDFLTCSAYKFFGPHVGVIWGRKDLLEELHPDKLRPSPATGPGKWMTGTANHEGIAGAAAAVNYLSSLGTGNTRRDQLATAFDAIACHENALRRRLLEGLQELTEFRLWGLGLNAPESSRVPTVSVTHTSLSPRDMATRLAHLGLYCWPGNHYAVPFTTAAGLEPDGTLRIGLLHYNTVGEVDRLLAGLRDVDSLV